MIDRVWHNILLIDFSVCEVYSGLDAASQVHVPLFPVLGHTPDIYENPNRGSLAYYRSELIPGRPYRNVYDLPRVAGNEIGGILGVLIRPVPGQQRFRLEFYHPNSAEYRESSADNYNPGIVLFPANLMEIGQELTGYNGADGPEATWIYNQWIDNTGAGRYQGFNPPASYPVVNDPPYAWFEPLPDVYNPSNTGGVWHARCC